MDLWRINEREKKQQQHRFNANTSLDWRQRPAVAARKHAKCWCFFDVETTGPSLRQHFVCALGLAIVALGHDDAEPMLLTSQKWFIRPPDPHRHWDRSTLQQFWLQPKTRALYERVRQELDSPRAVEPHIAMCEFVAMCRYAAQHQAHEATLMSDTSGFDFSWLYYYLSHFGPPHCASPTLLFGTYKPVRDITSYFAGVSGAMHARYPHRLSMQRARLDEHEWHAFARRVQCPLYDHDPEHDAVHVALRSAWIVWRIECQHKTSSEKQSSLSCSRDSMSPPLAQSKQELHWSQSGGLSPVLRLQSSNSGYDSDHSGQSIDSMSSWSRVSSDDGETTSDSSSDASGGVDTALQMAFVVRTDLRMRQTKVSAHCARAALAAIARLSQHQESFASAASSASNSSSSQHRRDLRRAKPQRSLADVQDAPETVIDAEDCAGEDDNDLVPLQLLRRIDSMQRYRAPDAATLQHIRDAARQYKLNYHLLHDERSNAPTVLAVGPASADSLQKLLHELRKL